MTFICSKIKENFRHMHARHRTPFLNGTQLFNVLTAAHSFLIHRQSPHSPTNSLDSLNRDVSSCSVQHHFASFWPRNVVKCGICYENVCTSVSRSVYLTLSWVTSKWFNISKYVLHNITERMNDVYSFLRAKFRNPAHRGYPNECDKQRHCLTAKIWPIIRNIRKTARDKIQVSITHWEVADGLSSGAEHGDLKWLWTRNGRYMYFVSLPKAIAFSENCVKLRQKK